DLAAEAIPEDPEDLMADIGLHAIDRQDDAALDAGHVPEAFGIGQGQGEQLIIAVQQVGDTPLADGHSSAGQLPIDLGDTAMVGVAERADGGHDVESELALGQCDPTLRLGPHRSAAARTVGGAAAPDLDRQPEGAAESDDGAVVGIGSPEWPPTVGTAGRAGREGELPDRVGPSGSSGHRSISTSPRELAA